MRTLIAIIALLIAVPTQAQVTVTGETVAVDLPGKYVEYDRADIVALRDSMWALDDIYLGFLLAEQSGQQVEIPPLSIEAERDSLLAVNAEMAALIAKHEEGLEIARQSLGQFSKWLEEFDSQ